MNNHDFDKSDVFESQVLPLLKEATDICAAHGIPIMAITSLARFDNKFRVWSVAQGNPARTPERMTAAIAVALPVVAAQLTNIAGDIAARFMAQIAKQEEGFNPELSELMRTFSAVSRMGITAHLIMRREVDALRQLDLQNDPTNKNFAVDQVSAIDKVIRTVFTAREDAEQNDDTANDAPDDLVGIDELPDQFRDFFRDLFGGNN